MDTRLLYGSVQTFFSFSALYFMMDHPLPAVYCYGMSLILSSGQKLLEEEDLTKARTANTISFIGLLMVLGHFYPWYMFWFQMVVIIEAASLIPISKQVEVSSSYPLSSLFSDRLFQIFISTGAELFYLFLYLKVFYDGPPLLSLPSLTVLPAATFPAALLYFFISFVQIIPLIKLYSPSVKNDEKKQ